MNIDDNSTATDFDNIDPNSQLELQIQIQETKEGGWIIDRINSMKKRLQRTGELNVLSYVKIPLRSNAI